MTEPDWNAEPDFPELRQAYDLLQSAPQAALGRLELLADKGSVMSMIYIARAFFMNGEGGQNLEQAELWYKRAAKSNSIFAKYSLAKFYLRTERSKEAFEILSSTQLGSYPPAMHELARLYRRGGGVERDSAKARHLLEAASAKGHVFVTRELGGLLRKGDGGLLQIPRGIFLFFKSFILATKALRREGEYSDKLI